MMGMLEEDRKAATVKKVEEMVVVIMEVDAFD